MVVGIHEQEAKPSDELKIGVITHAYEPYGSGGAYTLRGCMIKAQKAIEMAEASNEH